MIPYILAGLSILIAGGIHWKLPSTFWRASFLSTVLIVVTPLFSIFIFQSHYLVGGACATHSGKISPTALFISALVFFLGFLISLMVGYFINLIRQSRIKT